MRRARIWDSGLRGPLARAGIGTIEAMLALVILTSALLGLAASALHADNIIKAAHRRTAAVDLARVQIEQLLAEPYDSLKTGGTVTDRVNMNWTIIDGQRTKEIVFVYQYDLRGRTRVVTIAAAMSRP